MQRVPMIRILIVDDQTLVREGFRKLLELEPGFEVVGTAGDGEVALTALEQLHAAGTPPDVILMDIRMPRVGGIAATKEIKKRWPESHVVILTTFDDAELIREGLSAGALGYSLKDITAEQLAMTVRTAAQGQALLQPEIALKVYAAMSAPPSPASVTPQTQISSNAFEQEGMTEPLTERERQVLSLVGKGATNREIAETLYLTEGTVKNHMTNVLGKIGARDRTQAALIARDLGLS
ncbi:MAG: response regulator transcription factor [Chloroflexota bacterium]|nr:response regulator transcription factor [Chloroflexota bacterium]